MIMGTYKTLEEKSKDYQLTIVDNLNQLQDLVENLSSFDSYRFRGVCQSKYHMLTSLQRLAPNGISDKKYMRGLLEKVKNDEMVRDFFSCNKIAINDLSCVSLMQHLGLPTPLLDFTTSVKVALAFASDGADRVDGTDETDGYCSLYYFDLNAEYEINYNVQMALGTGIDDGIKLCQDYYNKNPKSPIDDSVLREIDKYVRWNQLDALEIAFIEYQNSAPQVSTLDSQILDLTNPNLSKQKGGFAINLYDDNIPFEENWNMRTKKRRDELAMHMLSGTYPFSGIYTQDQMVCIDIKKDVILEWNSRNPIQLYDNSPQIKHLKNHMFDIKKEYDTNLCINSI